MAGSFEGTQQLMFEVRGPAKERAEGPTDVRAPLARRSRRRRVVVASVFALLALAIALFAVEAHFGRWRAPSVVVRAVSFAPPSDAHLRVMTWNIAKAYLASGFDLAPNDEVRARLDEVAKVVNAELPDVLVLTEVADTSSIGGIDQVAYLAEKCGFARSVFAPNYSFGWPGLSVRAGNAVLARFELSDARTFALSGGGSLWNPTNTRRVMLVDARNGEHAFVVGAVRNDSFDADNNLVQMQRILELTREHEVLLAGDFNAQPGSPSLLAIRDSGRFAGDFDGDFDGAPTFVNATRSMRIDFVFAPAGWEFVGSRVLDSNLSDHRPVVADFIAR